MRNHHYQKLSHVVHAAVHNLAFASLEIQKRAWDENLGGIAQLVERLLCKQDVRSSNLLASTSLWIPYGFNLEECAGRRWVCSSVG